MVDVKIDLLKDSYAKQIDYANWDICRSAYYHTESGENVPSDVLPALIDSASIPDYNEDHPWSGYSGLHVVVIRKECVPKSPTDGFLYVYYGVPSEPITDSTDNGGWIVESDGSLMTDTRGIDVSGKRIAVTYRYPNQTDDQWDKNKVLPEWNRGYSVQYKKSINTKVYRRRVSSTKYDELGVESWQDDYQGKLVSISDDPRNGVYLCTAVRIWTNDNGNTYNIRFEFLGIPTGHDPFAFWQNKTNACPNDVVVPPGMILPYPTVRECTEKPYGVIRPEMYNIVDFTPTGIIF